MNIDLYLSLHRALFPLAGKVAITKKWPTKDFSRQQIEKFITRGNNLGWRLAPTDLIIDVDPRNGGMESINVLLPEIGFASIADIRTKYPIVKTGGGGFHIHMTKDPELKIRKSVKPKYKGLDFLSKGAYIAIAGCTHPDTGKLYRFDKQSPFTTQAPAAPAALLGIIQKTPRTTSTTGTPGSITKRELRHILKQLPTEDFASNEEWFTLMCAAHQATNGTGLDVFLKWSMKDENYAGLDEDIIARWESLDNDKDDNITVNTLFKALIAYDGAPPDSIATRQLNEFFKDDFHTDAPDEISPVERKIERIKKTAPAPTDKNSRIEALIDDLTRSTSAKELSKVLRKVSKCNAGQQTLHIRDIATHTGLTKTEVKKLLSMGKKKKQDTVEDMAFKVTTQLLEEKYENGDHLVHSIDQQYWFYNGKYWQVRAQNMIDKFVYEQCYQVKTETADQDEFAIASMMLPAERILRARVATDEDVFRFECEPKPIINVKNGELHIDVKTGTVEKKPHSFESYLINCLENVRYNPKATAPIFTAALARIFGKEKNPEEMVSFIYEIFGYTLQPKKNIPAWFLMYGTGSNGKSTVMKVLSALLKGAVLEMSIRDFDTSRNSHAYEMLPGKLCIIDDDIKSKTTLPDDFLKKISENKQLTANPKHQKMFSFTGGATPIMACNQWPRVNDISDGMLRRAYTIPFRKKFQQSQKSFDLDIVDRIIADELPGVLNMALEGLQRLRKRGAFQVPDCCESAKQQWQYGSNPSLAFIGDCIEKAHSKSTVTAAELYEAYTAWCDDQEVEYKYRQTKRALGETMKTTGYKSTKGTAGQSTYKGIKVILITDEGK